MDKKVNELIIFCIEYFKSQKNLSGEEIYDLYMINIGH